MQTIWLQRSSSDIPWGFRLVGGREFGVPLSVQRVTPGSVAAAALGPGDVILKVGNVMATNLEHNDAQELVRQATNILQLTIKKPSDQPSSTNQANTAPGYGNYMSAQLNDNTGYGTTPRGFGTGLPLSPNYSKSNETTNYATTPRNYGSQHQQPTAGTRIEIKRVIPTQQQSNYNNNIDYNDYNVDTGGSNFPDYTIAYRKQDPIHDSPGGPVNIRVYNTQNENTNYSSPKPQSRDRIGYSSNDGEGFGGASGPPAYEPRSQYANQGTFSPRGTTETRFSTGIPIQTNVQKAQQSYNDPPAQSYQTSYNPTLSQQSYGYAPMSPVSSGYKNQQYDSTPAYNGRDQSVQNSYINQSPSYGRESSNYDQSNIHGPSSNTYQTPVYSKPAYTPQNLEDYNSAPSQYHQSQRAYEPTQVQSSTFDAHSAVSHAQSKPYQSYISQASSSSYQTPPAAGNRRVSFDQTIHEPNQYPQHSSFNVRSLKSPPPAGDATQGYNDYVVHDSGISSSSSGRFSRQSSRHDDPYASSLHYTQSGPLSPRADTTGYDYGGNTEVYDPSGVSTAMDNLNFSPRYEPPPPVAPAPPPPPPPPPPGPPPPPAPPIGDWSSTPQKRSNYRQRDEPEEQKIPDQILNTMLKSAKGGGPKPFSYGIDLSELKKKIGPPTAPKPRGQSNYPEDDDDVEVEPPRQYGGHPKKPAGYVQSDYFISRDDSEPVQRSNKKPAGYVQGDYYQNRDTGPRSEVDESPINIHMGTNPKKQSKSFKVLQWMTETDKEDPNGKATAGTETSQKAKRPKDPQRRHNADDDEMRFSGLHSKADIPSKAFGILQRISSTDSGSGTQNGRRSFDAASGGVTKEEEDDDDLPDTLNSDDMVDRRYKGGNIPSKVFKVLQMSVGDDTPEAPSPPNRRPSGGGQSKSSAPVSDF